MLRKLINSYFFPLYRHAVTWTLEEVVTFWSGFKGFREGAR